MFDASSLDAHPISSLIESDRLFDFSGGIQDANLKARPLLRIRYGVVTLAMRQSFA
ncbi:MAG: hypothetical protein M3128_00860 [Verrucomicrobiota bacterium]|nr:hypothetical protein [Verrucomicrobiota bacterium]